MLGGKVQPYRRKSDAQCMGLLSQCICTYWHSYKCPGHSYVSICLTAVQAAGYVTVTYWGVQATWTICSLTYCWYSGHQRSIPLSELPQRFSDFFHSTVTSIRSSLDSLRPLYPINLTVARFGVPFNLSLKMKWRKYLINPYKNVRTRSSASIFSYPLSWRSSSTPHIYHQWLSALRPFPICFHISDREASPQENNS